MNLIKLRFSKINLSSQHMCMGQIVIMDIIIKKMDMDMMIILRVIQMRRFKMRNKIMFLI